MLYLFVNAAYFYVLTPAEVASVAESSSVAGETASRFFGLAGVGLIILGLPVYEYFRRRAGDVAPPFWK